MERISRKELRALLLQAMNPHSAFPGRYFSFPSIVRAIPYWIELSRRSSRSRLELQALAQEGRVELCFVGSEKDPSVLDPFYRLLPEKRDVYHLFVSSLPRIRAVPFSLERKIQNDHGSFFLDYGELFPCRSPVLLDEVGSEEALQNNLLMYMPPEANAFLVLDSHTVPCHDGTRYSQSVQYYRIKKIRISQSVSAR